MPTNYSDTNHLTPTTAEAIAEQLDDITEASQTVDGCTSCGMAYSFFFNTQFHKEDCTEKKV